jgi:hypothetical protein
LKTGIAELGSREYRFTSLSKMSKADVATRRTDISFAAGSGHRTNRLLSGWIFVASFRMGDSTKRNLEIPGMPLHPRLRRVPEWQPALIPPVVAG